MFTRAWGVELPRLISRRARVSSSEMGGVELRATASIACGRDNPALSALASKPTMSGRRPLKVFRRRRCRNLTKRIGSKYATTPAITNCGAKPNRQRESKAPTSRNAS